ncbi:MAG: transcriptional repressor LexA [Christensenellales bacterium]|jgi:repressor LexA
MAISAKQQRVLEYIRSFTREHGYPPAVRDICQGLGLKSTSTAHGYLERLEKNGYIRRDPSKTRAIELIEEDNGLPEESFVSAVNVPLLGQVAAGQPILAEENLEEYLPMPKSMVPYDDKNTFALEIRGESMIKAGILNGDKIIVRQTQVAENGDIIVAMIENEATCKRFFKEKDRIRLQPENDLMEPMYFDNVQILGKVIGLIRNY